MNKLNIIVIFFPFISTLLYALIFFSFQRFYNRNYLGNLIYTFIFILFANNYLIFKFFNLLTNHQIFYILFVYLCSGFIFMNLIQIPISSLQAKILKIIFKDQNLTEKLILKKYNSGKVFDERIDTLLSNKTIITKKSVVILQNKKILFFFIFIKFLKKIYKIKIY